MKWLLKIGLPLFLVAALILTAIYWPGRESTDENSAGEWTCSMHPQIRRPQPGKCPICGMNLVPVSQVSEEKERIEKRAGILTEAVAYRELSKEIRTVGKIDYSERQVALITARFAGRVQRVFADFTGMQVKKDFHLVNIYSPELLVTIQSLLDSRRSDMFDRACEDYLQSKRTYPKAANDVIAHAHYGKFIDPVTGGKLEFFPEWRTKGKPQNEVVKAMFPPASDGFQAVLLGNGEIVFVPQSAVDSSAGLLDRTKMTSKNR